MEGGRGSEKVREGGRGGGRKREGEGGRGREGRKISSLIQKRFVCKLFQLTIQYELK